ncbi:MAG: M14 family zinc carboxypeptidase [Armatimonadota bacterium]
MSEQMTVRPAEPSGNGHIVDVRRAGESWRVRFASEPRTSPQPLWFHIEARDAGGAPVEFVWELPDICLGDRNSLHLLRPVLRADAGDWTRCENVSVDEHDDGRRSLRFSHAGGADAVAAAFCFPYAPEHLDATLTERGDAWERSLIGVTHESRSLERLRLAGSHPTPRPGVYLMARQHSGETPGSWVLDGILRFLASDDDEAAKLRDTLDVWACPFVDLDGVVNGDYGKDALPWDYNRAWERLPMRAAVHAIQRDLERFHERTGPRIVIDLHGPGHSTPGVYLQLPRGERPHGQRNGALEFAEDLATHFPELSADRLSHETSYPSRWNKLSTLGSWTWDYLGETQCVSVEASYQRLTDSLLYPADYHEIGRRVIRAANAWLARRDGG